MFTRNDPFLLFMSVGFIQTTLYGPFMQFLIKKSHITFYPWWQRILNLNINISVYLKNKNEAKVKNLWSIVF